MAKSVAITGATSFLGRYIVRELGKRGLRVFAIIRPQSRQRALFEGQPHVSTVLSDMDQVDVWKQAIGHADFFLHLGWDGVGAQGRANTEIQEKNLADAQNCYRGALDLGCKAFLFAGSQAEYGPQTAVITEETPCRPVTEYGKYKLKVWESLSALETAEMTYYHTRIFSVYGVGDHEWALIPSCIRTLLQGGEMKLSSGKQLWNYLYVTDAAYAMCELLLSDAKGGIYHIAGPDTRPLCEFAKEIHRLCENSGTLLFGAYDPRETPPNLRPDLSKLERAVGQIPHTPFETGIRQMIDLYRSTGEQ